jgi:hypothetical protein
MPGGPVFGRFQETLEARALVVGRGERLGQRNSNGQDRLDGSYPATYTATNLCRPPDDPPVIQSDHGPP